MYTFFLNKIYDLSCGSILSKIYIGIKQSNIRLLQKRFEISRLVQKLYKMWFFN